MRASLSSALLRELLPQGVDAAACLVVVEEAGARARGDGQQRERDGGAEAQRRRGAPVTRPRT